MLSGEHPSLELAKTLNVAHRIFEFIIPKIKIIYANRLLKIRRIDFPADTHQRRVVVRHVIPADQARRIRDSARGLVAC